MRDFIVALVICFILVAVFWLQRKQDELRSSPQFSSAPIYNRCARDDYPCLNETSRPWNSSGRSRN